MGWGIVIKDVFLRGHTKDRLESEIEDSERYLEFLEKRIIAWGAGTPNILITDDEETDLTNFLVREISDLLEQYKEESVNLHMMRLALENESYDS